MKRPFLHIFIFFSVGIIYFNSFNVDINLIKVLVLSVMISSIVSYLSKEYRRHFKYQALIALFLLGILVSNHSIEKNKIPMFYGQKVNAIGIIKEITKKEAEYEKYILHIEKIKYKEKIYNIDEKLILNTYEQTDLDLGDKILSQIEIKQPNRNTNPNLFNYKLYLESKGIFATSSTKKSDIKTISKGNLSSFEKASLGIRENIILALDSSLSVENSNIIKSIILGDDSFLTEENINDFRKLGLSHILAVSGLHIGIIFSFLIYTFDLLKIHRKKSLMLSIIIIWLYALIIGIPPSVLRATLMFSFLAIGKLISKRYDSLNILSFAGFLMLIYRPMWIFSVGFQLSFIATFTILLFLPKIKEIIKVKNKKLNVALSIIITAQVGVLPISIYYFNEFQTLSVISNLIVAPILTVGIIIGFLIIVFSIVSLKISLLIGIFGNIVLNLSNVIVENLAKMTTLNIWLSSPSHIEIFFYYFSLILLLKIIDTTKMKKDVQNFLYLSFFIMIFYSMILDFNKEAVTLEFIDVGQGDSCLVRFKDRNILIDTGGNIFGEYDIGKNILLPYLRKTGVRNIDAVFLSHFHADHVKGLLPLFGEVEIKNIFIGYQNEENELYREILKLSKYHGVRADVINQGDTLKLDSRSHIEVLYPSKEQPYDSNENENSLVFILNIFNREILFTGDIEEKSEDYIVNNSRRRDIDIIKVPHHGSKTSSKEELIKHFNPRVGVIQLGKNNFGHPNQGVLERYSYNNTKILRNDKSGLIRVVIDSSDISFEGYLKDKDTFLRYLSKKTHLLFYILGSGAIFLLVIEYREFKKDELWS